jgi:hypothetical protein
MRLNVRRGGGDGLQDLDAALLLLVVIVIVGIGIMCVSEGEGRAEEGAFDEVGKRRAGR